MSEKEKTITAQDFFYTYHLGFKQTPWEVTESQEQLEDVMSRYLGALCMAIGYGGVYTPEQVKYLKGYAAISSPQDQSSIDKVEPLLKKAADLVELDLIYKSKYFTNIDLLRNTGRSMLYDMIQCAEIANFPGEQMYAISMVAEDLGVTEFGMLDKLKEQVILETEMRKKRIQLLFPR